MACIWRVQNLWKCRIMVNYEYKLIGYFKTESDAVIAYNNFIISNKLKRRLMDLR